MAHLAQERGITLKKGLCHITVDLQQHLKTLCTEQKNGARTNISFLRGVGHNSLSLAKISELHFRPGYNFF